MVFLISDRRSRVGPSVIEISALTSLNYSSNSDFLGLSWVESYQGREGDGSTEENRALGDGFEISVSRSVPSRVPPCFKISGTIGDFDEETHRGNQARFIMKKTKCLGMVMGKDALTLPTSIDSA
ncbi:hypothetical protein NL676_017850 [Syzygium grande]|nr:hypothetical protein NL676_017850 [Syzygium grande]